MPKVSVIIPVYNVEKYLAECLNSVIKQTFSDWEAICVNDGSTDNSDKILEEYAQKDSRIKIITQENKGLSGARNTGISNARGEYILFLDSDDSFPDYTIDVLYKIAERTGAPVVASCKKNPSSTPPQKITYKIIQKRPFLNFVLNKDIHSSAWNKIYRKELIQNRRFIEGIYFEDWPFLSEVFADLDFYAITQIPCYIYREENESITRSNFNQKKAESYLKGICMVYEHFKNRSDLRIAQKRMAVAMKMLINKTYKTKDKTLQKMVYQECIQLLQKKIVYWFDLPIKSIFRLWKLK